MLPQIKERIEYFEKLDKETVSKHHVFYIEPDYDCLIWEDDTALCGSDCDSCSFEEYGFKLEPDKKAQEWLDEYYDRCLIPVQTDEITRESLNDWFDWEGFHLTGIQIALRIAHQLPDNCELWYTTPYEDISGSLPNAILIKKAK